MEFKDLQHKIKLFNQTISPHTTTQTKDLRGNQYELEQFNYKMKKNKYIHKIREEKKGFLVRETTEHQSFSTLYNELDTSSYSKPWNRINGFHKKKLIIKYLDKLLISSKIDNSQYKQIKIHLFTKIDNKNLTKKDVDYDSDTFCIHNIVLDLSQF